MTKNGKAAGTYTHDYKRNGTTTLFVSDMRISEEKVCLWALGLWKRVAAS